ncbi:MAG: T9SS type A sorting domain-containing protein [Runella sp.]
MKKTILIYSLAILTSLLRWNEATAQSEVSPTKSRLNMGKKPVSGLPASIVKPASLDRSINLRPSVAINAYYRSVLLNTTNSSNATPTAKNRTNSEVGAALATESRPNTEEAILRSEDLLFSNEKIRVLNAFPNPANDYAEIQYQVMGNVGSAKIGLFNILGTNVGEYELDKNDRQLRLPTREMPTGVYFYKLLLDGKTLATKKLLIRH